MKNNHFGIGIDIEKVSRFKRYLNKNDVFLERYFSKSEIDYCFSKNNPAKYLAARFCGKEALIKALSVVGIVAPFLGKIEILHSDEENPLFTQKLLNKLNVHASLSLSHTNSLAIAVVLVIK